MKEAIAKKTGKDEYTTLFVNDDTIIRKRSQQITGKNRHSGKTYSRFDEKSAEIYSWKRNNRMRVYQVTTRKLQDRGTNRFQKVRNIHDMTTHVLSSPHHYTRDVNEGFQLRFGKSADQVFREEYPMLAFADPAKNLTPHLVAKDASDLTLRLYGNPRYRKDLVRAVGGLLEYAPNNVTSMALVAGKIFAGLAPNDWLVGWIPRVARETEVNFSPYTADLRISEARRMFRTASEKQIRRLLTTDGNLKGFQDTLNIFQYLQQRDDNYGLRDLSFGSFKELHDALARDQRKIKNPSKPIEYTGSAAELPGEYGEYRIVAPKDTWELAEWGETFSNCISGYGYAAIAQTSLLYAVYRGAEMVANMELTPKGDIKQLLGKYNSGVDAEIQDAVYDAILARWPYANVAGGWQGTVHNRREPVMDPAEIRGDRILDRPLFYEGADVRHNWNGEWAALNVINPYDRRLLVGDAF